ncbi:hypothetical protein B0H15DRAFT_784281 [Mycena belliarum]|uniref:RING-type domain-containing protein n=1 Tax=Mycena belliarum TaxID=1033014 RepID=A0AAD6XK93_9AGAR|nr:hypothetical protein B0H15DRAFT_784281 [Mycena belliae]
MTARIAGAVPGVLDPQQPYRLLRRPSSTLSFASFDPRAASGDHGWDLRALSLNEELYRPRRVVIETACSGESFWRFVPKARWDEGVTDEGEWPRVIDICGQRVECSQDQWDIYKLDYAYECRVRGPPEITMVTVAPPKPRVPEQPLGKHRMSSAEPCPEMPPAKTLHLDEEDEVADMVIDDEALPGSRNLAGAGDRAKKYREEELSRNAVNYSPTNASKRTRTFSPGAAKRDLETRRLEREKQKRERREQELNHRKQERYQHFLNEIYAEVPNRNQNPTDYEYLSDGEESGEEEPSVAELDAEAERMASIAESRRKLAELEADRPLWEQEARKRKRLEKEAEEAQRARIAERRAAEARKADQERRAKLEKEQQQAGAQEAGRARAWEERARREREKRQRNERWSYGPWTTQRALERYKTLSDIFDSTKFSQDEPLTFDAVPWPVLHSPVSFSVEDVDWAAVEGFFAAVKPHLRSQDFISFVEKSHRRFHPDRWRSRGLLKNVVDEADRGCLEVGVALSYKACNPQACNMSDTRDSLRRIRSAGDMPVSTARPSEPTLFQPSNYSSDNQCPNHPTHDTSTTLEPITVPPPVARGPHSAGLVAECTRSSPLITEHPAIPVPPAPPPLQVPPTPALPDHNVSSYTRIMTFFGYGRGASRARKLLVSLWYNLAWGFVQVVLIITMLAIATHTESKTMPGMNEWEACDRPLGTWSCIYVFRVFFSSSLTYWGWRRDSKAHANAEDPENTAGGPHQPETGNVANTTAFPHLSPTSANSPTGLPPSGNSSEAANLPHSVLYSRLSMLSSLVTLSWFLTAHILEYTSIHTCRFSSPHIWWLTFGILCIMYLVVLEVIILGFVVFVVAPIVFLFWNIFLMCLGRHPMQNPTMIRQAWPDVAKLSPSVVDRIPLVMYIPPPPDAPPDSIPIPQAVYSYPPKQLPSSVQPKRRFRFIRRRNKHTASGSPPTELPERTPQQSGEPQTWQDHWEHTGYPFVVLEGNRAACAVCLMDFEEPKRIGAHEPITTVLSTGEPEAFAPVIQEVPVENANSREEAENQLKLEDAGEGAQPLRLLACGHVFHKTCLDPWLTDVSGRCPVCQRAVELPAKRNKK